MRVRAIKDLCQLNHDEFCGVVAEGLKHIEVHASKLFSDAKILFTQKNIYGAWILKNLAEEEAAKCLILLDAVRYYRKSDDLGKHLQKFNNHLAKGIYSIIYSGLPATYIEVKNHVESLRDEFYLDGPEGIEWIFRNTILQEREHAMYIDYVDAGDDGHSWLTPSPIEHIFPEVSSKIVSLTKALDAIGCTKFEALKAISKVWRDIEMHDAYHWQELEIVNKEALDVLKQQSLLLKQPQAIYKEVIDNWSFPLFDLVLSQKKVSLEELHEIQKRWNPG